METSTTSLKQIASGIASAMRWKNFALSNHNTDPLNYDESEKFMKMGDSISLFSVEQGGFISANGFDEQGCQLKRPPSSKNNLACQNFIDCVFEVFPKFKYDAQITLDHELSNIGRERSSIGKFEQGDQDIEKRLVSLRQIEHLECRDNEAEFLRVCEKDILYMVRWYN